MDIEQCKKTYEMLKKGKQFIANIDKDFFLSFAETVLSELEKKEAIINEMAEYIDKITFVDEKEDYGCDFQLLTNVMCNHNNCKECIKEYFTNKVEREGK